MNACIFCEIATGAKEADVIRRYTHCYVLMDRFPVNKLDLYSKR